jgi:hypothetical protein
MAVGSCALELFFDAESASSYIAIARLEID